MKYKAKQAGDLTRRFFQNDSKERRTAGSKNKKGQKNSRGGLSEFLWMRIETGKC
jgi:hypothetical protein